MRPVLPTKFGSDFWFLLFMIALCFGGMTLALAYGWGYRSSVAGLLGIFYVYRLVLHVRAVRLGQKLKLDPELSKLYYGREI